MLLILGQNLVLIEVDLMIWQEFFEKLSAAQENGDLYSVIKRFLASKVPESAVLDYKWQI